MWWMRRPVIHHIHDGRADRQSPNSIGIWQPPASAVARFHTLLTPEHPAIPQPASLPHHPPPHPPPPPPQHPPPPARSGRRSFPPSADPSTPSHPTSCVAPRCTSPPPICAPWPRSAASAKAQELGSTRFQHQATDDSVQQIVEVDGQGCLRGGPLPPWNYPAPTDRRRRADVERSGDQRPRCAALH